MNFNRNKPQYFAIAFIMLVVQFSFGQNYRVHKGERPPIDLKSLTTDAWNPGVLKIKLTSAAAQSKMIQRNAYQPQQISALGIEAVDALSQAAGVKSISETFYSPAFQTRDASRHQAWGFDRWFTLKLEENADIPALVASFNKLEEVEHAEPDYRKRLFNTLPDGSEPMQRVDATKSLDWVPDDPRLDEQWHYHNTGQQGGTEGADIDLFEAWEIEKGSVDVIVAIQDEGIQFSHPDLAGNMWEEIGFNFVNNTPNINPGDHGTHVAGTVAAVNNNGLGVAGIAGGSGADDGVRLMSAQVFSGNTSGGFELAPIYSADNGAAISQNSWGYTTPGVYDQSVLDAIDYFNLNGGGDALSGGISIYAAGNDDSDGQYYPGYYSGTFSIAGTNNQDKKSWYSNYGDWVDISAPGGETEAVIDRGVLSTVIGNGYAFFQGTSMACPHASGVAALAVSLAFGDLTAEELADILRATTDDHYEVNPNFIGKLGTGRLNAYNVLIEAQAWLDGVRNPSGFSAEALDQNNIQLNWPLNDAENPVIIAFSGENQFGDPIQDSAYAVGDTLIGGGVLLYAGSDTTFLHTELLSASRYYYRIWSYSDTLAYSTGRTVYAETDCELYHLPFSEGFEDEAGVPFCWTQEIIDGPNWLVGSGNGENNPANAYEGENNIYFRSEGYFNNGLTSRLITPQLDMSEIDTAFLGFYYTNPKQTFIVFNWQDELKIKYKANFEDEWITLESFNTDVVNWTEVNIQLPNLSGSYYIAFEGISNSGYGISIDEITINGNQLEGFVIMASAEGNGTIDPDGEVFVPEGESQQFDVEADFGHYISALLVDDEAIEEATDESQFVFTFDAVNAAHTITAHFMPKAYDLIVDIVPQDAGSVSISGELLHGELIELSATSNVDYSFSHWAVGGDSLGIENPFVFELLSDTLFEAHFKLITGLGNSLTESLRLYPNPTKDNITIELPADVVVRIFDLQGRLQYEAALPAGKGIINLSGLNQAAYIIKLQFEDQVITKRILRY
ncbi:MAG: S8 family serine peptidase [Bacteroidales bacterium]|nr:S8 family serine peptidase [Bacteroidales bacterium]